MRRAPAEFSDVQYGGSGVIDMSHRSEAFLAVLTAAEVNLRQLLTLSNAWRIRLFNGYGGGLVGVDGAAQPNQGGFALQSPR
jgi:phosphoserine aminotransferase